MKKPRFQPKLSKIQWKNTNTGDIFPYFSTISLRSGEILTGSGKISSNLVKFSPHLCFFHCFLAVPNLTDPPTTCWCFELPYPITPTGRQRVSFFSTWFRRVDYELGTNLTQTDPWTALLKPIIFCCKTQAHALEFSLVGLGIFYSKQNTQLFHISLEN